jgi:hypothetical protein
VAAATVLAAVVVLALFVHVSRRSDVLDDVIAVPAGTPVVTHFAARSTTLALPKTKVRHAGDVALRMTLSGAPSSRSAVVLRVLGTRSRRLATCRFARGSFGDTTVLRCPVADIAEAKRVRIDLVPHSAGLGVVGTDKAVGQLLVPRSSTMLGRLATVVGRIGAKHPAAFSAWIVPVGAVVWLAAIILVAAAIIRMRDESDTAR